MRALGWALALATIAALCAAEGAFYLDEFSPWKHYAALFWIACSATVVASTWMFAFATFLEPALWRLPGKRWYLTAFLLPPALVLLDGGGIRFSHIDSEGLQQLTAGLKLLSFDPSLGIFRVGYSRYLARPYVLECLPTCLAGPSLWAARFGTTMLFVGSYLFFLSALVTYFRRIQAADPMRMAAYCGIMTALGHYVLLHARKFEQTSTPIAVVMLLIGALLLLVEQPSPLSLVWAAWSFGFMPFCYPPALGAWALGLAAIAYLALRRGRAILMMPIAAYGLAALWVSVHVTSAADSGILKARFRVGIDHFTPSDWAQRLLNGVRAVVGSDYALIPPPLALAALAAAYLSWRYREWRFWALCAWGAAVAFASLAFVGSNLDFPNHDIQRAMIIIPPLAVGSVLVIMRHGPAGAGAQAATGMLRAFAALSMAYMVFTGTWTVFSVRNVFGMQLVNDFDEAFAKVDEVVHTPGAAPIARVYVVPPLKIDMEAGLGYFAPGATVVKAPPPAGEHRRGTWVISYLRADPADRFEDEVVPSRHPRPYLRFEPE